MRIKNYKILCFLLILFVICSGMCLESIKTDSTFACAPIETPNSHSISFGTSIGNVDFCTVEMLGIRNDIRIQRLIEQDVLKGLSKLWLVLPGFYLFLISLRKFFASSEMVQIFKKHQEEVVLNYIHKSDGKKRI